MSPPVTAPEIDWLAVCGEIVEGLQRMLAKYPTTVERAVETGRGKGGDQALVIDRGAEEVIFGELDLLHARGHRFCAISEERGEVDYGDWGLRVIVDPIDGSMNAKRCLSHYAVSIAVAEGETMADVIFGFVYDFGAGEQWSAHRDGGAFLDGVPIAQPGAERRVSDGRLELVAIESADPQWVSQASEDLLAVAHRLRALGSIAVSMCQVASTRVDGMATLWRCRAVDAAAAQLIVRESGGLVAFTAFEDPLAAPLDLAPHSAVVTARTPRALAELARLPVG